jgi:hypothetical protein
VPEIDFEPEAHEYRVNGKRYISTTQALQAAGLIDYANLPPFYAERGSAVHLACEYDVKGTLDEANLDSQIAPYLKADREFRRLSGIVIHEQEKRFVSEVFGYAGTIDRIVTLNGRRGVLDLKAGHPAPWHGLQLASYVLGEGGPEGFDSLARWNLYLREDGTFKLVEHSEPGDFLVWQAVMAIARFKRRKGLL